MAGGSGGGLAPLRPRDQKRFDQNRARLLNNIAYNQDCVDFLIGNGIDPGELLGAVMSQEAFSGNDSTASMQQGGVEANTNNPAQVIGNFFQVNNQVLAVAQPSGTNVFYRNGGVFGTPSVSSPNIGHEAIHNLTGKNDTQLLNQLKTQDNSIDPNGPSSQISDRLQQHCNH